ncbi:MAG: 50S ribosomal protein L29 [Chloroflexi bacterium]|nr:50S ribosomal protein L29 [Chloroflexota bacterium]
MKISEMRGMNDAELGKHLADLEKEFFTLRLQLATKKLANFNRITVVKREIAQVKTILREREIAVLPPAGGE